MVRLEGLGGAGGGLVEGWRAGGWRAGGVLRYSAVRLVHGQVISDTSGSVCDTLRFAIKVLLEQPCV